MAKNLLNDKQIRLTKPKEKDYLLADGDGLFLRVRSEAEGATKDWLFVFSFAGKRRRMGFGGLTDVSLALARSKRDAARGAIKQQIDPQLQLQERTAAQAAKRAALEAEKSRLTIKDLFEKWERLELSSRKDGGKEVKRSFKKDVLPKLGKLAAEEVKRTNVAAILDGVVERGSRIVARNLLGDIRQMYGFAIARGLVENDPTSHMKRDDYGKKKERDRVLSESEIKQLHTALPTAKIADTNALALWIQLATACRIGEVVQAKWADVNLDAATWRIPSNIAKNEKEHIVALSPFARAKFEALHTITSKKKDETACEWVMPARLKDSHLDLKTITKQVADRQRGNKKAMSNRTPYGNALLLPSGKWTPHDLRRTAATMMVSLGVMPEVVERCLNHVEQNRVKRIYQRHSYVAEMKQAWYLLGDRLALLTSKADNVVTLQSNTAA